MPWIQGPQGGAAPPPHVCSPPCRWPWLSRRRHPSGAVWECEFVVLSGVRGETQGCCGRRWRLEWLVHENPCGADPPTTPVWTEVVSKRPDTPPPGRSGVSRVGEGGASRPDWRLGFCRQGGAPHRTGTVCACYHDDRGEYRRRETAGGASSE